MSEVKPKTKAIIVDKAPNYSTLNMHSQLGYTQTHQYQNLVDALNQEFSINISVSEIDQFETFDEVVQYVLGVIG